jgi:hypothetical protein
MARSSYGLDDDVAQRRGAARGARSARSRGAPRHAAPGPRQLRAIGHAVLAAAVLSLLTILTFTTLPRYQMPGEPWLDNLDFQHGFEGWETSGIVTLSEDQMGLVHLQNRNPEEPVYLRRILDLPPGGTTLHVAASVAAEQVVRGDEAWHTARIYLVQIAPNGDFLWNLPFKLVDVVGTVSPQRVTEIFEIRGSIDQAMLGIELAYATGQFQVGDITINLLEELPSFRLMATLLVAGWSLLVAWVGWQVLHSMPGQRHRTLLLITLVVLVAGLFMPSTLRHEILNQLTIGIGIGFMSPGALGHLVVFAILALLVRTGRPHDPLLLHISCWVLVAAVTEILQLFTVDRDTSAADWLANVAGASIGLALAELGRAIERRLTPPSKPRPDV